MKKMIMLMMMLIMLASLIFVSQGIFMHNQVNGIEAKFHAQQNNYFSISKATRDAAESGSELNAMLAEIKNTPSELLRLKLVGVGKMLTGIYALLFGILIALVMMPTRLGKIIKGK